MEQIIIQVTLGKRKRASWMREQTTVDYIVFKKRKRIELGLATYLCTITIGGQFRWEYGHKKYGSRKKRRPSTPWMGEINKKIRFLRQDRTGAAQDRHEFDVRGWAASESPTW